jgi:hypothetical protein
MPDKVDFEKLQEVLKQAQDRNKKLKDEIKEAKEEAAETEKRKKLMDKL